MIKLTTEDFIKKANTIHHDFYDYSKVNYVNNYTKIEIIDPEYGSFYIIPKSHLRGGGHYKRYKSKNLTTNQFIEKAKLVHGNLYDYSKVNYINSKNKVIIIDPIYGEYEQIPSVHLNGHGNPIRAGNKKGHKTIKAKKDFIDKEKINHIKNIKFIEKAKKIHGNLYDYSKVNYVNNHTKIEIIDPEYGSFYQRPNNHLNGTGCPERSSKKRLTIEDFIKKAREVHGDLYDYRKSILINTKTKIIIIDKIYGEFEQTPYNHLRGCGHIKRTKPHLYEIDHIIPLSLICKRKDHCLYRDNDLFKLLNSDFNKKLITREENQIKRDKIILFGKEIKARNNKGDIDLIRYLLLREHNIILEEYINFHSKNHYM